MSSNSSNEIYHLEQVQVILRRPRASPRRRSGCATPMAPSSCDCRHGTGPVDAVYKAINRIVGVPNELIEFSVQAVTRGHRRRRQGGHSHPGRVARGHREPHAAQGLQRPRRRHRHHRRQRPRRTCNALNKLLWIRKAALNGRNGTIMRARRLVPRLRSETGQRGEVERSILHGHDHRREDPRGTRGADEVRAGQLIDVQRGHRARQRHHRAHRHPRVRAARRRPGLRPRQDRARARPLHAQQGHQVGRAVQADARVRPRAGHHPLLRGRAHGHRARAAARAGPGAARRRRHRRRLAHLHLRRAGRLRHRHGLHRHRRGHGHRARSG